MTIDEIREAIKYERERVPRIVHHWSEPDGFHARSMAYCAFLLSRVEALEAHGLADPSSDACEDCLSKRDFWESRAKELSAEVVACKYVADKVFDAQAESSRLRAALEHAKARGILCSHPIGEDCPVTAALRPARQDTKA